jgi:PAS domain S-box-containing protein
MVQWGFEEERMQAKQPKTDVARRGDAEERPRELHSLLGERHFRLLVESVRDYAIFMLDPDGRVASWNAGAAQIKQYRAEEIIGQHFSVFYPEDVREAGWPAQELQIALRDGRVQDEGWRVRRDGSRFWASVVITALHDDSGEHIGFAKVTRDLTDQRRVKALEDEGRRMTTFLAMLGHELRNPLAPIANAVSVMQLEKIESENMRRCRDIISRQVTQLTRLVNDLLDVGRITSGKVRLEFQPMELSEIVREAIEMVEPIALTRSQLLTVVSRGPSFMVSGDHARLVQVFSNLLNNAVKFTPDGGKITATLRRDEDYAEVSVKDNGPGIPPSRLSDIFNLFVQGEDQPAHLGAGLGLGLSLVQQLVTLHGGDIGAFSTGIPGKGSEFIVRLPLLREDAGGQ